MVYVLSTGSNRYGESCQIDAKVSFSPTTILPNNDLSKIIKIVCGREHTMILLDDGQLFGIGRNFHSQVFGYEKTEKTLLKIPVETFLEEINNGEFIVDISCSQINSFMITNFGNIYWNGFKAPSKQVQKIETNFEKKIDGFYSSSSASHFFVKVGNKIYGSGWNSCGQLGIGSTIDMYGKLSLVPFEDSFSIKKIGLGAQFSVFASEYQLFACGLNDEINIFSSKYQPLVTTVSIPFNGTRIQKVECGGLSIIVQLENNEIFAVGKHFGATFKKLNINEPIVSFSAGWRFHILLGVSGSLYVGGANSYRQLGTQDYESVTDLMCIPKPKDLLFPSKTIIVCGESFSFAYYDNKCRKMHFLFMKSILNKVVNGIRENSLSDIQITIN